MTPESRHDGPAAMGRSRTRVGAEFLLLCGDRGRECRATGGRAMNKHVVIVNTARRPAQALAVIETLRALASGKHRIDYILGCDAEDPGTRRFFATTRRWTADITIDCRPRPASLQEVWNRN